MDHHLDIADFAGASAGLRGVVWVAAARPAERETSRSQERGQIEDRNEKWRGGKHLFTSVKLDEYAKECPEVGAA